MTQTPPRAQAGRATIYTVAERAGVSHQTVARYLRGETLREANRERVEQALQDLDYRVNEVARELATRRARRIGALVFDVDDWAPQRVLAGATSAAREADHVLEVVRVDLDNPGSLRGAIQMMDRASLAGVVVLAPPDFVAAERELSKLRVPWLIEVEPTIPAGHPLIHQHPVARAVRHLAELGHERFFHLGGPSEWPSGRNRAAVFHAEVRSLGLQDCGGTLGPWGPLTGHQAMTRYPHQLAPTALVAGSDQIALGAMSWLHDHGIDVPGRVSITGYDGLRDAAFYSPPLTTLEIDFLRMGRRAVQALLAGEGLGARPSLERYPFDATLVVRDSTAAPGRGVDASVA